MEVVINKKHGSINLKRIVPVMRKEFLHVLRDKRSLFIALLVPLLMIILYGYAVTFDIKKISIGIIDRDNSSQSRQLIQKFTSSRYFVIYASGYNNIEMLDQAMRVNRIKMIMVIPRSFSKDIKRGRKTNIQMLCDGSESNTINVGLGYSYRIVAEYSKNVILETVNDRGIKPKSIPMIEPMPRVWYNPELKSANFIIPGLIAIIMMLLAALLTSLTIVKEKERGTFEQLISTPLKPIELMLGKLVPYIVLCLIDIAVVVVFGILWFKVPFYGQGITLFVFSIFFIFCALGLGLFVSSIAPNQQVAVVATVNLTVLPSVLLSGFVFPIDSMPVPIQAFTYIVPARYFVTALRSIFLKEGTGFSVLYIELLYLMFVGVLFLFIAAKRFKKNIG